MSGQTYGHPIKILINWLDNKEIKRKSSQIQQLWRQFGKRKIQIYVYGDFLNQLRFDNKYYHSIGYKEAKNSQKKDVFLVKSVIFFFPSED